VLDRNGFLGVPPGTSIKFIMEPETLKSVDKCATAPELERGKLLMATIVDERIDPDALSVDSRLRNGSRTHATRRAARRCYCIPLNG